MNLNAFQVSFYRFSYRYHLWVWRIGWILASSIVFCALATIGQAFVRRPLYVLLWGSLAIFVVLTILRLVALWGRARAIRAVAGIADFMSRPYIDRLWWILWIGAIAIFAIAFGSVGMWQSLSAWLQSQPSLTSTRDGQSVSNRSYRPSTSSGFGERSTRSGVVSTGNLRPTGPIEVFWASLGVLQIFTLVWLVALVIWLLISSWHSLWFRYLAFWLSVGCGKLRRWLLTGWRGGVVLFAAVTLVAWVYSQFLGARRSLSDLVSLEYAPRILVGVAILVALYWAFEARQRIVILAFSDYTGNDNLKVYVEGIAPLLLNHLVGLADLYQIVEEASPFEPGVSTPKGQQTIGATMSTADVGQTLQKMVSTESKVKLGVFEFPVGALLGVLGRIVEGPRLIGSLHQTGDELVLIASLQGGALHGRWRVSQSDLETASAANGTGIIEKLIEQMAYRIFTDLERERLGSPNWRAVHHFHDGLRAYVRALHSPNERFSQLHRAKEEFITALQHDEKFARCHYNLGMIYARLEYYDAALAAFLRAADQDPNMFETYNALAWTSRRFGREPEEIDRYGFQDLSLRPAEARAWNLLGLVRGDIESFAVATALAWRRLCQAAWLGQGLAGHKTIASTCAHNLASVRAAAGHSFEAILGQAISLQPTSAWLYLSLAVMLHEQDDPLGAEKAMIPAISIQASAIHWSYLACIEAALSTLALPHKIWLVIRHPDCISMALKEPARWREWSMYDCWAALVSLEELGWQNLDTLSDNAKQELDTILNNAKQVVQSVLSSTDDEQEKAKAREIRRMIFVQTRLWKIRALDNTKQKTRLKQRIKRYDACEWCWGRIQTRLELARLSSDELDEAQYTEAIEWLRDQLSREQLQLQRPLRWQWGYYYSKQGKFAHARQQAEQAAAIDPSSCLGRANLGRLYAGSPDYDRAETELVFVLESDPASYRADEVNLLGRTLFNRGAELHDAQKRREAYRHAVTVLGSIIKLFESEPFSGKPQDIAEACGWAHYWLSRFYVELGEYDQASHSLRVAVAVGFKPFEGRVMLGWLYFKLRAYDQAGRALRDAEAQFSQYDADLQSKKYVDYIGEQGPLEVQRIRMLLYGALVWTERGVNLTQALIKAREAGRYARHMSHAKQECPPEVESLYQQCTGWIHLRARQLGRFSTAAQKARRLTLAVKHLEHAVSLTAEADAYYRLGKAYSECAQAEPKNELWTFRAREAYRHCKEADLRGEYTAEIDKILAPPAQPQAKPDVLVEVNRKDVASGSQSK
jgi:tetratricopeptide (TPR) repeat protein